jgi:hypothetical protein
MESVSANLHDFLNQIHGDFSCPGKKFSEMPLSDCSNRAG